MGRHQLRNVALAIATAVELNQQGFSGITAKSIERGIPETRWLGRFQVIAARPGWPEVVIDAAHNPAGAWALRSALSEQYEDRPVIFVFGAMRDKAISEMTEILFPLAERVIATSRKILGRRRRRRFGSRPPEPALRWKQWKTCSRPWTRASHSPQAGTVVVITGSIYLVGEVMRSVGAEV